MEQDSRAYIAAYIERARKAQQAFEKMSQEEVDKAVQTIGRVVYENAQYLAEIAVEETGMGNAEDKFAKNRQKAGIVWNNLRGKKSRGRCTNAARNRNKMTSPVIFLAIRGLPRFARKKANPKNRKNGNSQAISPNTPNRASLMTVP